MTITFEPTPNGHPNWVTEIVLNAIDSVEITREAFIEQAKRYNYLTRHQIPSMKKKLYRELELFLEWPFTSRHHQAFHAIAYGLLRAVIHDADYQEIYAVLRGGKQFLDVYEVSLLTCLGTTDWQSIIEAQSGGASDTALIGWLDHQMITWVNSPDARKQSSSLNESMTLILNILWTHIDVEWLTKQWRGEE